LESYVLRKEPPKLLLVRTDNIRNGDLINLFDKHIELIVKLFSTHSLIEVSKNEIVVHT